ncbi:MAG TPA: hypothetical protein VGJ01_21485 [Pseudolabrys sp.]|jgi:hypothetical protein
MAPCYSLTHVKGRDLTASNRAYAAAEACAYAENTGKVAKHGEVGRNRVPKVGTLISHPRDYSSEQFGVNRVYVGHARALLRDDPVAFTTVNGGALSSSRAPRRHPPEDRE